MKTGFFSKAFLVLYVFLVFFQLKTTNIKEAYSFTPHQIDLQIRRMNTYPSSLARLGYVLEVKKESLILEKIMGNFFTVIDFKEYFPNRLPYILAPFIFVGLYFFVVERKKRKALFLSFLFSIFILTLIGPYAKYGPILMYSFFLLFILLCFQKIKS